MEQLQGPSAGQIKKMFTTVADRYDVANTVMSAGIHHLWRKKLVKWSGASKGQSVLDCATGTGDLAIEFKKAVGAEGTVIGTDFCEAMILPAPKKARARGLDIDFAVADVTALEYPDHKFDISSIAFGIRNVQNPVKGLQEMARVTKSGGVVMVLEFGQPDIPIVREAYQLYSEKALPYIGGWVSGNVEAYKYLQKSSVRFPHGEKFIALAMSSGSFSRVEAVKLSFGICYAYKAWVR